ncbi:MAG: hypothetical protein JSV61_05025 [Anaerolineales bacterium]|nr:MAG: hypothetical protein JSV61_05025 [Anaerolineales bacterium]
MAAIKGRYLAYLLRLWQVKDAGKLIWRASLEDSHTGDRQGFPSLEALVTFLLEQVRNRQPEGEAHQANEGGE